MYCKFCGNSIVPSASNKCTFCGSRIDLYDGGQSFFKDAEIETWNVNGASDAPDTGMPRTQVQEFAEVKNPAKAEVKTEELNPMPSKLSLKWIAGVVAFVLLVFGVVKVFSILPKDSLVPGDENPVTDTNPTEEAETQGGETSPVRTPKAVLKKSENQVKIDASGKYLLDIKHFLYTYEGYKNEGPDRTTEGVYKYSDNNDSSKKVIGVTKDSKVVYIGGKAHNMNVNTIFENEIYFVDAEKFLDLAFGYSCEYDASTGELKIYDKEA